MEKVFFAALSVVRRLLRKLGIAQLIIKIPYVAPFFWFLYVHWRPEDLTTVPVREFGFKMCVDPRDNALSCTLLMLGSYEPFASQVFSSLLQNGMTVVDIGANVGYYTLLAATRLRESGKVFSFEPEPRNFDLLLKNLSLNGLTNVFPQQKALLDRTGTCRFYLDAENLGRHGIYTYKDSEDRKLDEIEVEATPLDDFFSGRDETIHVIKMDAEGAEPLILKGMKSVIARCDKLALFTEFILPQFRAGGHSPETYLDDLARHGFVLHLLDEQTKRVRRIQAGQLMEICAAQPDMVRNLLCLKHMDLHVA